MSYKLHYFAGYGRGEALRMLLAHAKVELENVNYTIESLPDAKNSGNLEFGQLPVLEHDGKFFSQSNAILRALGKIYGYYPEDPFTAYRVDSTIDLVGDLLTQYYKAAFYASGELQKTLFSEFYGKTLPTFFEALQKRIDQNSSPDKVVGDKMTIADFALASVAYSSFMNESNPSKAEQFTVLEKFPKLLDYFTGLGETMKEYLETRPKCPL